MTQTIRIPKPRDPLSGMIASYRSAYARKWRVPVSEVEEPADRAPETSGSEKDAFVAKIRGLLFGGRQ
ncbi:MAG: hypothetical protein ACK4SQ_14550 [Allorhizobium sp.]